MLQCLRLKPHFCHVINNSVALDRCLSHSVTQVLPLSIGGDNNAPSYDCCELNEFRCLGQYMVHSRCSINISSEPSE